MNSLAVSGHFQKQLKRLPPQDREKTIQVLKDFLEVLKSGKAPSPGCGFKKINGDKYEIRVDIRKRIVMKAEGNVLICHLIGDHNEVKRYLREFRNK